MNISDPRDVIGFIGAFGVVISSLNTYSAKKARGVLSLQKETIVQFKEQLSLSESSNKNLTVKVFETQKEMLNQEIRIEVFQSQLSVLAEKLTGRDEIIKLQGIIVQENSRVYNLLENIYKSMELILNHSHQ